MSLIIEGNQCPPLSMLVIYTFLSHGVLYAIQPSVIKCAIYFRTINRILINPINFTATLYDWNKIEWCITHLMSTIKPCRRQIYMEYLLYHAYYILWFLLNPTYFLSVGSSFIRLRTCFKLQGNIKYQQKQ